MTRVAKITLTLNGTVRVCETDHRSLLVEAVRKLGAKGTRVGCLTGDCGACTVVMDGIPVKSCLVLAVAAEGSDLTTIEGTTSRVATAVKDAFVARKGFQCGYCTSGMIVTATDFLEENPEPSASDIRQAIAGNLCRCTGYDDIVSAIAEAADSLKKEGVEKNTWT